MTAFTEISVITDGEAAEAVAEVLRPFAYQESVVLEQLGDPNNPLPTAVAPAVTVKIFVAEHDDTSEKRQKIEEILYHMNRLYPIPAPQFKVLEEKDWANAWKDNYHPFRLGERIWIRPSWSEDEQSPEGDSAKPGDIVLVMDPGMAFGTGLHPTTQMCLQALESIVSAGDSVLDVGTGTGILAIAAAKLGATTITAVDTDETAVRAAMDNAGLNNASQLTIWQGGLETVSERPWRVVVVNILAPVIINLLKNHALVDFVAANGRLILSGIIEDQLPEVEDAIAISGAFVARQIQQGDWVALIVQPDAA